MTIHSDGSVQGAGDANRRLVRFFSVCLGSLVFVYSLLAMRIFIEGSAFAVTDWMLAAGKVALGAAALLVVVYPAWLAGRLERQIDEMGALFEGSLCRCRHRGKDPDDRAGDDGQPAARTGHDPLAGFGLPGVLFLQEFHAAGLLPRPRRRLRGVGKAALRARPRAADAGAVRRHHHAVALRHRRDHRSVLGPADAGADLDQHLDGQAELAAIARPERAALFAARHQFRAVRLHLLSDRPALRQTAAAAPMR